MTQPFAFVFPGQGSQAVGMLDAWGDHAVVRETLQEASDALGEDLAKLIHDGPQETLALTVNTQPVVLVASVAIYRAWLAQTGSAPAIVAGHSLGEYSALVAAGALTLTQAAPLVRFRAQAMQEAVPVGAGAMAAILGLDAAKVRQVCLDVTDGLAPGAGDVVQAVNFNDPLQTVIAGTRLAVEKACLALKEHGAKRAMLLPVSAPFHSSLMQPAAEKLREKLAAVAWQEPQIPLLNNIDVAVQDRPESICDALYRQVFGPVRWVECVQAIQQRGIGTLVECGPGKVLSGMVKRIDATLLGLAMPDPAALANVRQVLGVGHE